MGYRIRGWIEEDIASAAANGQTYTGPTTWEEYIAENPENWEYLLDRIEECKTIGNIPTSLINGGDPSVINGEIVFDPTP